MGPTVPRIAAQNGPTESCSVNDAPTCSRRTHAATHTSTAAASTVSGSDLGGSTLMLHHTTSAKNCPPRQPRTAYNLSMEPIDLPPDYPRTIAEAAVNRGMTLESHLLSAGEMCVIRAWRGTFA